MLISIKRIFMANKKFYYNKNRGSKPKTDDSAIQKQIAQYSAEQLDMSLESLGLSDTTRDLLAKNRIAKACDLVKRTEKDMYKVQGLNKKVLFEVKDALKANGMALRQETEKSAKPADKDKKQPEAAVAQGTEKKEKRASKFGLVDRQEAPKNQQQNAQKQAQKQQNNQKKNSKPQKPEKLVEPLLPGEWRKVLKGGKWGYSNGFKIVIPTVYDEIFAFKEGLASVEIDEKCGYIDEENNVVIPLDYDTAMSFSEGLAMVVKGDKCGYINKNNEVVIPFEFDAATPFEGGEAKIKKDGKWGTISTNGTIVWI